MFVWPDRLAAFYPYEGSASGVAVAGAIAVLIVLSAIAWLARPGRGFLPVGWLWFLGTMVPVVGLVQIGMQSHADRYTYVPFIGLFIAVVWLAGELAERFRHGPAVAVGTGGIVVLLLASAAYAQAATWKTSETLWSHAVAVTANNAKAHNSLGAIYGNSGRAAEAEAQFKEALRLKPDLVEGLHIYPNLGRALVAQGKVAEAVPYLEQAHRLKPDDASLASDLGFAYLGVGRTADAIAAWREAVRLDPRLERTWFALGVSLGAAGRAAEAREALAKVLELNPKRTDEIRSLLRLAPEK